MIIYSVTCNVEPGIANEWLTWMQNTHIPEVMATGAFSKFTILRVLTNVPDDACINYSVQYYTDSEATLAHYRATFGPALQQKTLEKYGENVLAFRTVLEIINS